MLTGRRFKLRDPIVAAAVENDGRTVAWMIPSSSVIEIVSLAANGLRMLDVLWEGKVLAMPESDLAERGDEILEHPMGSQVAVLGSTGPLGRRLSDAILLHESDEIVEIRLGEHKIHRAGDFQQAIVV